jgi:IMP dehydrogenase
MHLACFPGDAHPEKLKSPFATEILMGTFKPFLLKLLEAPLVLSFRDVILLPGKAVIEPSEVKLKTNFTKSIKLKVPLVSAPMDTVTTSRMAAAIARCGGIGVIHRNMSKDEQIREVREVKASDPFVDSDEESPDLEPATDEEGNLLVAAAVSPFDLDRAKKLSRWVDALVVDVAHFHNESVIVATKKMIFETGIDIVVGNVGSYEATEEIINRIEPAAIRAGMSSGSICITGEVTGAASPTLWATAQVSQALADYGIKLPVIADGGIRGPGDAAKAFAVGASSVMLGFVLAGSEESPSQPIMINGRIFKLYRGMGSLSARAKRYALDRYSRPSKEVAEGIEMLIPYKGKVVSIIKEFVGGLKAAFGYAGASTIEDMWTKAKLGRVTPLGRREISGKDHSHSMVDGGL